MTTHAAAPVADEPPALARQLGHAGLIPFVLGALLVWAVRPDVLPYVTLALAGYAAAIVAFLGGVHWGLAMRADLPGRRPFAWATVPPVVSSVAILMPAHAGLVILGLMLIICYAVDRHIYTSTGQAAWLTLRFRLTAVATLCCFLGAAGT